MKSVFRLLAFATALVIPLAHAAAQTLREFQQASRSKVQDASAKLTTNDFRIVNGKLYNRLVSTNWTWLSAGYSSSPDGYSKLVVRKIISADELMCDLQDVSWHHGEGFVIDETQSVILLNYHEREISIGFEIFNCRAMRLPCKPGDTVNTYDYGLPNTVENRKRFGLDRPATKS